MKNNHAHISLSKDQLKVTVSIVVLIALATALSIAPPLTQTTIALGFIAFWLAGAAATIVFLIYSSRNKSHPA